MYGHTYVPYGVGAANLFFWGAVRERVVVFAKPLFLIAKIKEMR